MLAYIPYMDRMGSSYESFIWRNRIRSCPVLGRETQSLCHEILIGLQRQEVVRLGEFVASAMEQEAMGKTSGENPGWTPELRQKVLAQKKTQIKMLQNTESHCGV